MLPSLPNNQLFYTKNPWRMRVCGIRFEFAHRVSRTAPALIHLFTSVSISSPERFTFLTIGGCSCTESHSVCSLQTTSGSCSAALLRNRVSLSSSLPLLRIWETDCPTESPVHLSSTYQLPHLLKELFFVSSSPPLVLGPTLYERGRVPSYLPTSIIVSRRR
jgi:hypothetical protein